MKVNILLVNPKYTREYGFMSYDLNIELNKKIHFDKYDTVYSYKEEDIQYDNCVVLNKIYERFQNGVDMIYPTPVDYKNRSLSVGDIIQLDNKSYYIDSFGFKELID